MNKVTIASIIAILACFCGIIIWTSVKPEDIIDYSGLDEKVMQGPADHNGQIGEHIRGKEDSKVVVMEYADMMCAGCAASTKTINTLFEEYGDRVAFVFRHFPIEGHPNSRSAASAVESAGLQGKFWEMLSGIYFERDLWLEKQGSERQQAYIQIFRDVAPDGDVEEFKNNLSDERLQKKINSDRKLGDLKGVSATPSFYVNGDLMDMTDESIKTQKDVLDAMRKKIDKALADNGLPTGAKEAKSDETDKNEEK